MKSPRHVFPAVCVLVLLLAVQFLAEGAVGIDEDLGTFSLKTDPDKKRVFWQNPWEEVLV
jgi:hypothetical protein